MRLQVISKLLFIAIGTALVLLPNNAEAQKKEKIPPKDREDFAVPGPVPAVFDAAAAALADEGLTMRTGMRDVGLIVTLPLEVKSDVLQRALLGAGGNAAVVLTINLLPRADSTRVLIVGTSFLPGTSRYGDETQFSSESRYYGIVARVSRRMRGLAPDSASAAK